MADLTSDSCVRVGDLALAAGLTVRALHHYEAIGLVEPSDRTNAGYRLYDSAAVARLYQVLRLRALGMPLDHVRRLLADGGTDLGAALGAHMTSLDAEIGRLAMLRDGLARSLAATNVDHGSTEEWMEVLVAMDGADEMVRKRISILVYQDLPRAHDYLVEVFGLTPGEITRTPDGTVVHAEVYGGDGVIWLHPETETYGLASPATLGKATATMAVMVDDVDAHYESVKGNGGDIVYGPTDQPYGYREYSARDCEGMLWSFMKEAAP